jgi:hypothetical protein
MRARADSISEKAAWNIDQDDMFLESIKSQMNEEHQSLLGIQVGRKKQALVVKLSDERKLKQELKRRRTHIEITVEEQHVKSPCFVTLLPLIHPYSKRLMFWQALLVVMIFYNAIFVPYDLAYGTCASSATTEVLDFTSDAFFILDVFVQLHVMLVIHEKHTDRTLIVDDRTVIFKE